MNEAYTRRTDERLIPVSHAYYLGNFAKDSNDNLWYTFEDPKDSKALWHSVDLEPPHVSDFGPTAAAERLYDAWMHLALYYKPIHLQTIEDVDAGIAAARGGL